MKKMNAILGKPESEIDFFDQAILWRIDVTPEDMASFVRLNEEEFVRCLVQSGLIKFVDDDMNVDLTGIDRNLFSVHHLVDIDDSEGYTYGRVEPVVLTQCPYEELYITPRGQTHFMHQFYGDGR